MEAQLAWAPMLVILLFICGMFVAAVIGLTALFRKSPALGGALVAVLGTGFLAGALMLFGYASLSVAPAPTAIRVETYPASLPPGYPTPPTPPMPPLEAIPAMQPMAPVPPRQEAPPVPQLQGVTRILSTEEIPVVAASEAVTPNTAPAPVEAPRPSTTPDKTFASAPSTPPDWVKNGGSVRDGDRTLVVITGQQFADAAAAWSDAATRAADLLRRDFEQVFRPTGRWQFDPQRANAIRNSFTEEIRRSAGENEFTVYRTYLQVELSPTVRHQIEPVWREQVSKQRSGVVAGLFAVLTAVVAALAGYFRLDSRTGGRYRRPLTVGTAVALAVALATALAVGRTTADTLRKPATAPPSSVRLPAAQTPHLEPSVGARDPERFRDVADRMVAAINAADYDGVRRDFNKPMRDAFPVERCGVFFGAEISGRFGRIDGLESPQFKSPATTNFVARCERGTLDLTLSLDERGQVAGMLLHPRPCGTPGTGMVECAKWRRRT
jgi:hypothetical protein